MVELKVTKTVEENARAVTDKRALGKPYSWTQLNRLSEELWESKNKLEFIGVIRDTNGKLCCVFQELIRNTNNTFKAGEIYKVENDVVLEFQKTKKPVKAGRKMSKEEILEE